MVDKHLRNIALAGVLGALGLSAGNVGNAAPIEIASVTAETQAAGVLAATPEDRAKALGYAKYLPKDTQAYFGVYDGKGFVKSILDSKLGTYAQKMGAELGDVDLTEITGDPEAGMVLSLMAEEFFVAVGAGAGEQANNLMLLNEASNFHRMKFMVKMLDMGLSGAEPDEGMMDAEAMMMPFIGGFLNDPRVGLAILEKAQMPPLTVGFKVSDGEVRDQVGGMIAGGLMELLEELGPDGENVAEELKIERGGVTYTGVKFLGKKLAAKLDEEARDDLAEVMDAASIERAIKIVGEKNLVVATGVHDGYIVLFVGADETALQVAASPAESVVADPKLACVDAYLGKKLLAVTVISKEMIDGLMDEMTSLGSMADGIKAGLSEAKGFGDTRDLEVLLDLLSKQEKALLEMTKYDNAGMVAYREDGLKVEGFGGTNGVGAKLETPHTYGSLAKRDNVLMFANWVSDEDYSEKSLAYVDTIGETLYLGAKRFSNLKVDGGDMEEFQEVFSIFEEKFRPDVLELWKAIRFDLGKGLGGEAALIVDLEGSLPTVPGIPQVIADEGKAPRIGLVKPVADRASIGTSWKRINTSMKGILKSVSEMGELDIPMQRPMSSEKNDLKTWFLASIPFQTDDFVLSVSIDENNFYASTSKSFVEDIAASLAGAKPDPARTGAYCSVDFKVLRAYLTEWVKLVDSRGEEIFRANPEMVEEVREALPMVRATLEALEDLDSIQAHTRMEGGRIRSSFHFKVN